MNIQKFAEKHYENILRGLAALLLAVVVGAFILAFNKGILPHSEDGDAFDTIYAVEESQSVSNT